MVLVSCKQSNVKVKQMSKGIDIEFEEKPLDVSEEIADYLLKVSPDMFYLTEKVKSRRGE